MKKLLLMLFSMAMVIGASAQIHGGGVRGGVRFIAPRVTIIGGYNPFPPYYGFGYGYGLGYNPLFGYPGGMYRSPRTTKLELQIEDIRNDYKDRIWSVKHATDLSRKEKRAKVHELKHERDSAVIDAKRNYYKSDYKS